MDSGKRDLKELFKSEDKTNALIAEIKEIKEIKEKFGKSIEVSPRTMAKRSV